MFQLVIILLAHTKTTEMSKPPGPLPLTQYYLTAMLMGQASWSKFPTLNEKKTDGSPYDLI